LLDADATELKNSGASSQPTEPSTASKNKKKKKGKAVVKSLEEMSVEEFEKSLQQMNSQ